MAVINPTYNVLLDSLVVATWSNMTTGDTAAPHFVHGKPSLVTTEASGTFNGGTTIRLQGSATGVTYTNAVTGASGNLAFTAAGCSSVFEAYPYWKPTIAAGSADSVTVSISYWTK